MLIDNCSSMPFLLAQHLLKVGRKQDGALYADTPTKVCIERPLERQPCSSIRSDPFLEFLRAVRVVTVGNPPLDGIEPDVHVRLSDLFMAADHVSEITPQGVVVIGQRAPQCSLVLDRNRTLSMTVTWWGLSQLCQDTRPDFLFFSVVLEAAARLVRLPVGRLTLSWAGLCERQETVEVIAGIPPEVWGDCYTAQVPFEPGQVVGDSVHGWLNEVDLLRTGKVMGLKDDVCRKVHAPIIHAHHIFTDEERGWKRYDEAQRAIQACEAMDWRAACWEWIEQMKQNERAAKRWR
ncbi:MAG: hypothetical protein IT435_02465 [Phycisphaerales bacterium]|nr:hypothetical protein [Phycisphaerales bacterium]